jgi:hypothetical protein
MAEPLSQRRRQIFVKFHGCYVRDQRGKHVSRKARPGSNFEQMVAQVNAIGGAGDDVPPHNVGPLRARAILKMCSVHAGDSIRAGE